MAETLTPDICIIGGGAAGLSVAAAAAGFGVPVVLIERAVMGGECLNTGCVPSKALLAAAKHAQAMREDTFGIAAKNVTVDFAKVQAHVRGVIAAIAPNDSAARFRGLGVLVIEAAAHFIDRATIAAGDFHIKARRFVIATGSRPAVPPVEGLAGAGYLTNETIFNLTELPKHLLIIGAGAVGIELAQAFRRLGSAVTVLEAARPLGKDDPECAQVVLDQLAREGVVIRAGVSLRRVRRTAGAVEVMVAAADKEETIEGSHLLVAAGRQAVVEGLGLETAGVKYGPAGIAVNRSMRTSNRRIYAIGDVTGRLQFTHAANYHAGIVLRNILFRLPAKVNERAIPWVTYTEPELAQTGLTEAQAREKRIAPRILRWPFHENDRAQAEATTRGHVKIITDRRGRILGATIVGAQAGELISLWSLAIAQRLNIRAMTGLVMPYPTLSEAGKRAAIDFFTPSLTRPWVRRIIAWLRVFG